MANHKTGRPSIHDSQLSSLSSSCMHLTLRFISFETLRAPGAVRMRSYPVRQCSSNVRDESRAVSKSCVASDVPCIQPEWPSPAGLADRQARYLSMLIFE